MNIGDKVECILTFSIFNKGSLYTIIKIIYGYYYLDADPTIGLDIHEINKFFTIVTNSYSITSPTPTLASSKYKIGDIFKPIQLIPYFLGTTYKVVSIIVHSGSYEYQFIDDTGMIKGYMEPTINKYFTLVSGVPSITGSLRAYTSSIVSPNITHLSQEQIDKLFDWNKHITNKIICVCGSDKLGHPGHSVWCDKN